MKPFGNSYVRKFAYTNDYLELRRLISYSCFSSLIFRSWNVYLHPIQQRFVLFGDWIEYTNI